MHSLGIVQWNSTRRDHPGNPGRVPRSGPVMFNECKTHLCFEFISHAILCILYPYSCKTHKISSKLSFVGLLIKSK